MASNTGTTPRTTEAGARPPRLLEAQIEAARRTYRRAEVREGLIFAAAIILCTALPSIVLITYFNSASLKILIALAGLVGTLAGVAISKIRNEQRQKHRVEEIREAEQEFFKRVRREVHSRVS